MTLILKISKFIKIYKKGILSHAPTDVYFNEKNVYQPDLIYLENEKSPLISDKGIEGEPDLI